MYKLNEHDYLCSIHIGVYDFFVFAISYPQLHGVTCLQLPPSTLSDEFLMDMQDEDTKQ